VYWIIALPPFAGAVQDTTSCVAPAVLAGADGAGEVTVGADIVAGTVVTVTDAEAVDVAPVPHSFCP
jgi:hypothetical protein